MVELVLGLDTVADLGTVVDSVGPVVDLVEVDLAMVGPGGVEDDASRLRPNSNKHSMGY